MTRFYDYDFIKYAFGKTTDRLDDEGLRKALGMMAAKFTADKKLSGTDYISNSSESILKVYPKFSKWIKEEYDLSGLNQYKDFFTNPEEFFKTRYGENLKSTLDSVSHNDSIADFMIAEEMMKYYFKSGACIRTRENAQAHRYDDLFMNIDRLSCDSDNKAYLKKKLDQYMEDYPTKEQLKEAYKDFVSCSDSEGLDSTCFMDLTDKEKNAIVKTVDSTELQRSIKNTYFRLFNKQALSKRDNDLIDNKHVQGLEHNSAEYRYERFHALEKNRGDGIDRDNLRRAVNIIKSLKEVHERRPWYQKLRGWFGGPVGKEMELVTLLKRDLVSCGADRELLERAIHGNENDLGNLLQNVQTREYRLEHKEEMYMDRLYENLGVDEYTTPNIYKENGQPVVEVNGVKLKSEDYKHFVDVGYNPKDSEDIENEAMDQIEEDFKYLKEIEIEDVDQGIAEFDEIDDIKLDEVDKENPNKIEDLIDESDLSI